MDALIAVAGGGVGLTSLLFLWPKRHWNAVQLSPAGHGICLRLMKDDMTEGPGTVSRDVASLMNVVREPSRLSALDQSSPGMTRRSPQTKERALGGLLVSPA